jgi:transcriptional regulator with XRE-family HTH domain
MNIGRKIRDLRLRRGMTVSELGAACDLSKGFISQVENDRTSPSLEALGALAAALQTSVAYLVVEHDPVPHVVRAGERPRLSVGGNTSRVEVVSAQPKRNLEMLLVEFPPGRSAEGKQPYHHGEECMLVLEGRVTVTCGDTRVQLEAGDSIHYDGRVPHAIENRGERTARVLTAITPAAFEPLLRSRAGVAKPRRIRRAPSGTVPAARARQ